MTSKGFGDSVKWLFLSADLPVERNAVSSCDTKAMKKFSWLIQPTIEVILLRAISSPFTSVMEGYGNKHTMGSGLKNTLVTKTSDVVKILQCIEIFIKVRTDYNSWRLEGRKKRERKCKKGRKRKTGARRTLHYSGFVEGGGGGERRDSRQWPSFHIISLSLALPECSRVWAGYYLDRSMFYV